MSNISNNKNYRFDHRTKEEFQNEIKIASLKEAEVALRICIDLKNQNKYKEWPILLPNSENFTR